MNRDYQKRKKKKRFPLSKLQQVHQLPNSNFKEILHAKPNNSQELGYPIEVVKIFYKFWVTNMKRHLTHPFINFKKTNSIEIENPYNYLSSQSQNTNFIYKHGIQEREQLKKKKKKTPSNIFSSHI